MSLLHMRAAGVMETILPEHTVKKVLYMGLYRQSHLTWNRPTQHVAAEAEQPSHASRWVPSYVGL
jgi:hypothetical protein